NCMTTKRIVMTTDSRIRMRLVTLLWALLSVLVITVAPGPASAATFTVTSTADFNTCSLKPVYPSLGFASSCTLRGAIEAVNAQPQGSGPHRINYSGIDPSGVLVPKQMTQQQGVAVQAPQGQSVANTVIRNNLISGNGQNGVLLSGPAVNNSHLVSNFIGTTADGRRAALPPDG